MPIAELSGVFRFIMVPAGLSGFLYRFCTGDTALVLFAVTIIVGWLVAWITGSTEAAQEQKNHSRLRTALWVTLALLSPSLLPFAVAGLGSAYLLLCVILLTTYFVGVQWLTSERLTLVSFAAGYVSYVGLLTGVFMLPVAKILMVSLVYALVAVVVSGVLQKTLGTPSGRGSGHEAAT